MGTAGEDGCDGVGLYGLLGVGMGARVGTDGFETGVGVGAGAGAGTGDGFGEGVGGLDIIGGGKVLCGGG